MRGEMRIAYIGKFPTPWNTEVYVTWALRNLGVKVKQYSYHELNEFGKSRAAIYAFDPDVVLFSKPEPKCVKDLLRWCKRRNLLTVCWLWDLYWGHRKGRKPAQFHADMMFSTDGGHDREFREYGCNHQVLRQGIHKPEHIMLPAQYKHDVAFVGSRGKHRNRRLLISWLEKQYGDRYVRHTKTRGLKLNQALAEVKLVVGDSHPSPNCWSNRVYEITGRGGVLMHPSVEGLSEEFTPGEHFIEYEPRNHVAGC